MTSCSSSNFAESSTLSFGEDRIKQYGPYRQLASSDGVDNTPRVLIDQAVDWTYDGFNGPTVRAHLLFNRPPRYVRSQGPRRHYIEEQWAITLDGSVPVIPGGFSTSYAGGHDRNLTSWYWNSWEAPMTYMPPGMPGGFGQVVRTVGQQIRVRYRASLAVSATGGTGMNVASFWHEISVITTPQPI